MALRITTVGIYPTKNARSVLGLAVSAKDYGASGSLSATTGSMTSSSSDLTLAAAEDFVNGQGIAVYGAGPGPYQAGTTTALATPGTVTVTPTGTAGTTSYKYYCAAIDAQWGLTAASSGTTSTGNATLNSTNYNALSVAAVTGASAYAWYGDSSNPTASQGLLGLTTSPSFDDTGRGTINVRHPALPASAPSASIGEVLVTTIASGAGTVDLVLAAAASNSVSSGAVYHDDTAALGNFLADIDGSYTTGLLDYGKFPVTSELSITDAATLEGVGSYELYGTIAAQGSQADGAGPNVSPYLEGSTIVQFGLLTNGISISTSGKQVFLRGFGVRFGQPHFLTGHGIYQQPPTLSSGGYDNGVMGAVWENVTVFGHDGDHYAFYTVNPMYDTFISLHGWGGGGIYCEGASGASVEYGSIALIHPLFNCYVGGTADGFHFTGAQMQSIRMEHPQIALSDVTAAFPGVPSPTSSQHTGHFDSGVVRVSISCPDFEQNSTNGNTVQFPTITSGAWFMDPGGIMGGYGATAVPVMTLPLESEAERVIDSYFNHHELRTETSGAAWHFGTISPNWPTAGTSTLGFTSDGTNAETSPISEKTTGTTTLNGTTAGTAKWVMPEQGTGYKKVVVVLTGYENTGTTAQTIAFPVAFADAAAIVSQPSGFGATVSTAELTLPTGMSSAVSGVIIIEGI